MENRNIENIENLEVVQTENQEEVTEKRSHKKKLLLLLMLLLVTGVLLGTSTYAWFTANKKVAVNDITVNVAAQNGIQISVDGTSWKSIIQTTDLLSATTKYAAAVNQIPSDTSSIAPVSTVGNIDANGRMEMYLGDVLTNETTGEYILKSTKEEEVAGATEGSFIAFDLFFKVDADTPVWITPDSGVTTEDAVDTGIKNATRMAFVMLGNTTSGDSLTNIQGLNAGSSATKYIWEPNYDVHTAAAVNNAYDTYGITTTQTGGSVLPYSGVKAAFDTAQNVSLKVSGTTHATQYADYFGAVTPDYTTVAEFDSNLPIWTFTEGITKVRVYMWVEGQDVDCENSASGGNITYSLSITSENTTT